MRIEPEESLHHSTTPVRWSSRSHSIPSGPRYPSREDNKNDGHILLSFSDHALRRLVAGRGLSVPPISRGSRGPQRRYDANWKLSLSPELARSSDGRRRSLDDLPPDAIQTSNKSLTRISPPSGTSRESISRYERAFLHHCCCCCCAYKREKLCHPEHANDSPLQMHEPYSVDESCSNILACCLRCEEKLQDMGVALNNVFNNLESFRHEVRGDMGRLFSHFEAYEREHMPTNPCDDERHEVVPSVHEERTPLPEDRSLKRSKNDSHPSLRPPDIFAVEPRPLSSDEQRLPLLQSGSQDQDAKRATHGRRWRIRGTERGQNWFRVGRYIIVKNSKKKSSSG